MRIVVWGGTGRRGRRVVPDFVHRVLRTDDDPRYVVADDDITPTGWVHSEGRRKLACAR